MSTQPDNSSSELAKAESTPKSNGNKKKTGCCCCGCSLGFFLLIIAALGGGLYYAKTQGGPWIQEYQKIFDDAGIDVDLIAQLGGIEGLGVGEDGKSTERTDAEIEAGVPEGTTYRFGQEFNRGKPPKPPVKTLEWTAAMAYKKMKELEGKVSEDATEEEIMEVFKDQPLFSNFRYKPEAYEYAIDVLSYYTKTLKEEDEVLDTDYLQDMIKNMNDESDDKQMGRDEQQDLLRNGTLSMLFTRTNAFIETELNKCDDKKPGSKAAAACVVAHLKKNEKEFNKHRKDTDDFDPKALEELGLPGMAAEGLGQMAGMASALGGMADAKEAKAWQKVDPEKRKKFFLLMKKRPDGYTRAFDWVQMRTMMSKWSN